MSNVQYIPLTIHTQKSSIHMTFTQEKISLRYTSLHHINGDVAQLIRASDQHAVDEGSIPWCIKGFFSQSHFQCRLSYGVSTCAARNFSPRVSFQCRLSYGVRTCAARNFSPRVSFQCRLSYGVRTCAARNFSPRVTFSADSLTVSAHPHAQSQALTSVHTLKIL